MKSKQAVSTSWGQVTLTEVSDCTDKGKLALIRKGLNYS